MLACFLMLAVAAIAQVGMISQPQGAIADTTDLIEPDAQAAIEKIAEELSSTKLIKFKMLVLFSMDNPDAGQCCREVFENWQMGGNGLLMVLSLFDRKYTIITGERVSDMLPQEDREKIEWGVTSYMARGKFSQGALFGATAVADIIRQYRFKEKPLIALDRQMILYLFLPMLLTGMILNFVMGGGWRGALATLAGGAFGYVTLGIFGLIIAGAIGLFLGVGRRYSEK